MRGKFNRTICDTSTGNAVPLATVEVLKQSDGLRAVLYDAQSGGSIVDNPFTSNAIGFAGFFLDPNEYIFVARTQSGSFIAEMRNEIIPDPELFNIPENKILGNNFGATGRAKPLNIGKNLQIVGDDLRVFDWPVFSAATIENTNPLLVIKDTNDSGGFGSGGILFVDTNGLQVASMLRTADRFTVSSTEELFFSGSAVKFDNVPVDLGTNTTKAGAISTATISAGNGTQAIAIASDGGCLFSQPIYLNTSLNISSSSDDAIGIVSNQPKTELALQHLTLGYRGGLKATSTELGIVDQTGTVRAYVNSLGLSSAYSMTAANFYGNGFNLTQLNASNVVNGTLPSNIFPATISASSITFSGNHIAKGGTAYNLLDITSAASILRDSAGNVALAATTTDVQVKRANNIVLNASATATQLFNHAGSIRANFTATDSQVFAPSGAPFLSATTTTATITSGNGATCLTIDSTGAGLMRFPVYTVATVPSASANDRTVIIVSNASLGRGLYTSDGTNWRSAQSGTILS